LEELIYECDLLPSATATFLLSHSPHLVTASLRARVGALPTAELATLLAGRSELLEVKLEAGEVEDAGELAQVRIFFLLFPNAEKK